MAFLEMRGIEKSYSMVRVLNGVELSVERGSVHALMGENGAGKSTLMRVLAGITQCDKGTVSINGRQVDITSPLEAQKLGVAMIHQELSPILDMTVAENIYLSREPVKYGMVDFKTMERDAGELLHRLGMDINPKAKMRELKVADQQMVEIAKAISLNAEIIIMDEPTSAITDREVDTLFDIIHSLQEQKKAIIYISHKMDEVFRICDAVTVLRDGSYIGTWPAAGLTQEDLIKHMVGRDLSQMFPKTQVPIGEVLLEAENLCSPEFENISFKVHAGEILGVAGLVGAGRTELMHALFGLAPVTSGKILLQGEPIVNKKPLDAIQRGIAYVSEDRKGEGLILPMNVGQNITLAFLKDMCHGLISRGSEKETIARQISALNIKTNSPAQQVSSLSGGNQQKVVLAKWLLGNPRVLILDEPTRGIDVGAKTEIYKLMGEYVAQGNAIIMISSEMPEVMGMSDRILVLSNRKMGGEINRGQFTQEAIMHMAVSHM